MAWKQFFMLPIEVLADENIRGNRLLVLSTLASFGFQNGKIENKKLSEMCERCGLPVTRFSAITSELEKLGWLEKIGAGGRGKPCYYQIKIPEAFESKQKKHKKTFTKTVNVKDETFTESVNYISQAVDLKENNEETFTENVNVLNAETFTDFDDKRLHILNKTFTESVNPLIEQIKTTDKNNITPISPKPKITKISEKKAEKLENQVSQVSQVFEHWKNTMHHPRAKLDSERKRLISKTIDDYGIETALNAITGCALSDFHMGGNPEGKIHDSLGLIFRNSEKIERFESYFSNPPTKKSEKKSSKDVKKEFSNWVNSGALDEYENISEKTDISTSYKVL